VAHWSVEALAAPWAPLPSLHDYIVARVDRERGRLPDSGMALPDEAVVFGDGLRWAAGAVDGVAAHHAGTGDGQLRARQIAKAVRDLLAEASEARLAHLYRLTVREPVLGVIDAALESVVQGAGSGETAERCQLLGRYLAEKAGHREAVKLGIALLGCIESDEDGPLLEALALHDEFALFCAVAIGHERPDHHRRLLRMAQRLDGWGRVHLVERLADSRDAEVTAWLLRGGYRNAVLYEYLACICARTGGLAEALGREDDRGLLVGAAEILLALVEGRGGPAESIDDYEDAPLAIERYLERVAARAPEELVHLVAAGVLAEYLGEAGAAARPGWDEARVAHLAGLAQRILARADWPERVRAGLAGGDPALLAHEADRAARLLGMDVWQHHFERAERDPLGGAWYRLLQESDEARLARVLELAERALPLSRIASGPATELGLGPAFAPHRALDLLLQELGHAPGRGWTLIAAGLRSPVVRNRQLALRAVAAWPRESWPPPVEPTLREAGALEPDPDLQRRFARVLANQPLDD
jgi:hypothetical protein